MKTSITTAEYYDLGVFNELDKMREHGYESADLLLSEIYSPLYRCSDEEYFDRIRQMKVDFDAAGIEVFQVHGPDCFPPPHETEEKRRINFRQKVNAIKACKMLDCKYMVTHCIAPWNWNGNPDPDLLWSINRDFFAELARVGEEYDVTVCLETLPWPDLNVSKPADIKRLIEEIASPYFMACLDTGHCTAIGISPADAARTLGKHIKCVHIHDNDGVRRDRHWIPAICDKASTDWSEFKSVLSEIGYEGTINLECGIRNFNMSSSLTEHYQKCLADFAKYLADGLEDKR